jgi:protein-S-isoprenylcysteine O-methyltransferase Ste14
MTAETLQSGAASPPRVDPKIVDLLAASPLIVWYGIWIVGQAPKLVHDIARLVSPQTSVMPAIDVLSRLAVFLFAAVLIFMFVARRPAAAKVPGLFPRVAAFLGAYLGVGILSLPPHPLNWELKALSALLTLGGMSFALWGLLYLGRSVSIMSEARKLVVGGPYAIVRHPLYLGELLALFGVVLQYLSPLALVLLALQLRFQLYRMQFEEGILAETFPEYTDYARDTWRLIPGIY